MHLQSTTANLLWSASTDTDSFGVWGYKVYRNGSYLKSIYGTSTTDTNLALNTDYCYAVSAYDFAGNESAQCTQFCLDRIPPSVPTLLTATPVSPSQVDLIWTAATDTGSGVADYKLYRAGSLVKSVTTTSASNGGLAQGTNYCFTVSTVDNALNESAQSSPTCTTTPSWQYEYIATSSKGGVYGALAIDSADHLHAVYAETVGTTPVLKYATSSAVGSWTTTTIASGAPWGYEASIAVDSNNKVHICYYDDGITPSLMYVTNASGSFGAPVTVATVPGGDVGSYNSIAVDKNNKVHISYWDKKNTNLMYATNALGSWTTTTVDYTGYSVVVSSIAVDSQGYVHISYVGEPTVNIDDDLKYVTNASGAWVATFVDQNWNSTYTSIAIDSNDKVHIAYYDWWADALKYATNVSGSWVYITIDYGSYSGYPEGYPSLKIDKNDKVHIAYQDPNSASLKHATNASGEWETAFVEGPSGSPNLGYSNSLVIDSKNKVHISTYDALNFGMRHEYY